MILQCNNMCGGESKIAIHGLLAVITAGIGNIPYEWIELTGVRVQKMSKSNLGTPKYGQRHEMLTNKDE